MNCILGSCFIKSHFTINIIFLHYYQASRLNKFIHCLVFLKLRKVLSVFQISLKAQESLFCFSCLSTIEFSCLFFLNDRWKRFFFFLLIVTWELSYWSDLLLCLGTMSDSSDVLLFQRRKQLALNHFLDSPQLIPSLSYLPSFSSTVKRAPISDQWWKICCLTSFTYLLHHGNRLVLCWMQSFCSACSDCWLHILCRRNSCGSLHLSFSS